MDQEGINNYPRLRYGLIMSIIPAVCWATVPIGLAAANSHFDMTFLCWIRFLIATIMMVPLLRYFNLTAMGILWRSKPLSYLGGSFLVGNFLGYAWGLELTSPSTAQVLIQSGAVSLAIFGTIIFREKIRIHQIFGVLVTVGGMTAFSIFMHKDLVGINLSYGDILILIAGVLWGVYAIIQKKLSQQYHPQEMLFIAFVVGTLGILPMIDLQNFNNIKFVDTLIILFLSANSLVAYMALGEALKYAPSTMVGMVTAVNPLITIFLMYLLTTFGVSWIAPEHVSVQALISALAAIGGVLVVIYR